MLHAFLVGIGGFIGAVTRHWLGGVFGRISVAHGFPYGTLVVNGLGCFLIGYVGGLFSTKVLVHEPLRFFVIVGILGGFTTFSSFGYETFGMLRDFQLKAAFMNVLLQCVLGIIAVWVGFWVARA